MIVVCVKMLFFKKTVKIEFEKTFAGAEPAPAPAAQITAAATPTIVPPTFADVMGGAGFGARAWDTYCLTYAED